uniref:Protein-tyrosine sulfotransferase n=1 Tax=Strongyloides papillosus TaxID=174720 RepID=A0A0N5BML8_STREA
MMMICPTRGKPFFLFIGVVSVLFLFSVLIKLTRNNDETVGRRGSHVISGIVRTEKHTFGNITFDNNSPFIFIGGMPRSGTTLMRSMMDAHPMVRCGEETRVIPRILSLRNQWKKSEKEWRRLQEAGVTEDLLDAAITSFVNHIIVGHGTLAERLCNKDPFTLKSTLYLSRVYPNAKFLLMIRDGRATIHSVITRKVTITGFDLTNYKQCLQRWNAGIELMYKQCMEVGPLRCMPVHYEQLVLHPRSMMEKILKFLDIPWNETVLHHEQFIGKKISLSKVERSSDQVVKPVNLDALTKWVGQIPKDVVRDMAKIAPMLRVLGYDPHANPPNYGTPDAEVLKKTEDIHLHGQEWYKKAVAVVNDPQRVDRPIIQ